MDLCPEHSNFGKMSFARRHWQQSCLKFGALFDCFDNAITVRRRTLWPCITTTTLSKAWTHCIWHPVVAVDDDFHHWPAFWAPRLPKALNIRD